MSIRTKLAIAIPVVILVVLPSAVLVAAASSTNNVWDPNILAGPLVTCAGGLGSAHPCTSLCDLIATIIHDTYFLIAVVIWIITPIMVAIGGLIIATARGKPEAISTGRKTITGTVIGLVIVLAAYLIIYTFVSVLGITGIGGFGANTCNVQPVSTQQQQQQQQQQQTQTSSPTCHGTTSGSCPSSSQICRKVNGSYACITVAPAPSGSSLSICKKIPGGCAYVPFNPFPQSCSTANHPDMIIGSPTCTGPFRNWETCYSQVSCP